MPPSVNVPIQLDDASLESFEKVDMVEMEDSSENDTSSPQAPASLLLWNQICELKEAHLEIHVLRKDFELIKADLAKVKEDTTRGWIANEVYTKENKDLLDRVSADLEDARSNYSYALTAEAAMESFRRQATAWEWELLDLRKRMQVLNSDISHLQSRSMRCDTLQADLDPVPQLFMRDMWADQERGAIKALTSMLAYARDDAINQKKEYLGLGHANVVLVMARWKESSTIQRLGCQILSALPVALHKHAASVGALDVILMAMKRFDDDEHLLEHGLYALHQLVAKTTSNMVRLVERLDGLPPILDAMRSFPDSAVAQFYGIRLLKALGSKHQFIKPIVDAGGLVVIGSVYAKWLGTSDELEKGVVELARSTLAKLVHESS